MSSVATYGYCLLVSASFVALLAMSTDFFVSYVNNILIPCQHDTVWLDGRCTCENTGGVFGGVYCDECQCDHLGICSIIQNRNSSSRWGCRCPSHQKWVGTLCDDCYASEKTEETCRGKCIDDHFGPKCNTVCLPYVSSSNSRCQEVSSGGGSCNACNGHGSCNERGECECDDGYFTSLGGEQCSLSCKDIGLSCPEEGGTCRSIGGKMQCVCKPNYFGRNCDQTCPGGNLPCSGHGTCEMDTAENLVCNCEAHFIGSDCSLPCPGARSFPTACSGHGKCLKEGEQAVCDCQSPWESDDCSCSELFTCSGHGTCAEDGGCECYDEIWPEDIHFTGSACERCQEKWFGQTCHLFCNSSRVYKSSDATDGLNIGCNGHGACSLTNENNIEHITCACMGTDPDTYCGTCMPSYYPDINLPTMTIPPCSVECNEQTCSYNGVCNPDYDGTNDLCICNKWNNTAGQYLDTLDPDRYCSACKPNWYPSDLSSPNRCSYYCAAEGQLQDDKTIIFSTSDDGFDYELQGDENAQNICGHHYTNGQKFYRPDPDCRVCSSNERSSNRCAADGTCMCSSGSTGEYCEIECGNANEPVCSGHGRCVRNDLDMWFNPYTNKYRCECIPYDTYTAETRQRLLKRGFQVEPPPSPDHYGRFCEFHCPRYNKEICTGRGECDTGIAVAEEEMMADSVFYSAGDPVKCSSDVDCRDITGSFCAQKSTPWDSLVPADTGKSFFSNFANSLGYVACGASDDCIDSIYSIEWDDFCVNMLNGWYPNALNTADCVYNEDHDCRNTIENFFMEDYDGDDTWCDAVDKALAPPRGTTGVCGDEAYANEEEFFKERVPICYEYKYESICNAQSGCIYDQTSNYIQATDNYCKDPIRLQEDTCIGRCRKTAANTCQTKTYCRAKRCSDAMFENNVESLCLDLPEACPEPTDADKDWQTFCAEAVGKIRVESSKMTSLETFFSCYMRKNSVSPALPDAGIPGDISINGIINVYSESVPVMEYRQAFISSRTPVDKDTCSTLTLSTSRLDTIDLQTFCIGNVQSAAPSWYINAESESGHFLPYLLVCNDTPIELFAGENEANKLKSSLESIGQKCEVEYRVNGIRSDSVFGASSEKADSIDYIGDPFTIKCLNDILTETLSSEESITVYEKDVSSIDFSDEWSAFPSGCVFEDNVLHQRWGGVSWTGQMVEDKLLESCLDGNDATWISSQEPLPTLADMEICGVRDQVLECPECEPHRIKCESDTPFKCINRNPCRKGAQCFKPNHDRISREYYCDISLPATIDSVKIDGVTYNAKLDILGHLVVNDTSFVNDASLPNKGTIEFNSETYRYIQKGFPQEDQAVLRFGKEKAIVVNSPLTPAPYISTLTQCESDINWFQFCLDNHKPATNLDTTAPFGLVSEWTGESGLMGHQQLYMRNIQYESLSSQTSLEIRMSKKALLKIETRVSSSEWTLSWHVTDVDIDRSFTEVKIMSFGPEPVLSSLKVSGSEQILPYADAMTGGKRQFYFREADKFAVVGAVEKEKRSDYSDWSFNEKGEMSVVRRKDTHLNEARGLEDGNKEPPLVKGVRWSLEELPAIRVSGWSKIPDSDKEISNMRLLTAGDYNTLVSVGVSGPASIDPVTKRVIVNGMNTKCEVYPFEWWHWRIEAKHQSHLEKQKTSSSGQKYFEQVWHISVSVNGQVCASFDEITVEASALEKKHTSKVSESFKDIAATSFDDCRAACHGHSECLQWSHTDHDSHCYLHARRCHEDSECISGTHTLRSIHSRLVGHFEIWSESTGIPTQWTRIRAEPIIKEENCPSPDFSQVDARWRSTFEEKYVPWVPDTTQICNGLYENWKVMPGYRAAVCPAADCIVPRHNLDTCASKLEFARPKIAEVRCRGLASLNWTAYCHYRQSFEKKRDTIPFLGGSEFGADFYPDGTKFEGDFEGLCDSSIEILDDMEDECSESNVQWFQTCLERVSGYEEHCSTDCLDHIETMLADNGAEDPGLCKKRQDFLDIYTKSDMHTSSGVPRDCLCSLENVVITDFCMIQDVYHDETKINIPDLYNSECSLLPVCIDTLRETLGRTEWRAWCKDLSDGQLKGVCSKTICKCDHEDNIGVSGPICELTCDSGPSDGKELACSGRNGQCFAVDPSERLLDTETQEESFEIRNENDWPNGPSVPKWVKGPDPSLPGRCQCAIGSGLACSVPCDQCNDGMYGAVLASQYGICDSYNGICRALPTFMRYNPTIGISEEVDADSTTSFESAQWLFPENFLYEYDLTIFESARKYMLDPQGLLSGLSESSETVPLRQQRDIKNLMRIWNDLCRPDTYDFEYMDNQIKIKYGGIQLQPGSRTLNTVTIDGWNVCRPIRMPNQMSTQLYNWYLCFVDGELHAFDETQRSFFSTVPSDPGALLSFQSGDEPAARSDMSFAVQNPQTIYAYGGKLNSLTLDKLYKIDVERAPWSPTDIVFLTWTEIVDTSGTRVPAGLNLPIHSFTSELFIAHTDGMYRLILPTVAKDGVWSLYKFQESDVGKKPIAIEGNDQRQIYVKFDGQSTSTFSPTFADPWSVGIPDSANPIIYEAIDGTAATQDIPCTIEMTDYSIKVGSLTIAEYAEQGELATIYLEEWSNINGETDSSIVPRVFESIHWRYNDAPGLALVLNSKEKLEAVDLVERVYMHQARWSIVNIMKTKHAMTNMLGDQIVDSIGLTTPPQDNFLEVFRSVGASFLAQTPNTSPNKFNVAIEGPAFKRVLVISANYDGLLDNYEQEIDFDNEIVIVQVTWTPNVLRVQFKQKYGPGVLEWYVAKSYRTWHAIIHIEEWQFSDAPVFKSEDAIQDGPFQLYAIYESSPTYKMSSQTATFLQYTASHCSLTADESCPGTLPYINLPCSGRGKCNIACQCACEVAKSVLQIEENALTQFDPYKSPWRGEGCEITCPGYDGYNLESICSGRPDACQSDGTCACLYGFTGDACQFQCPKNDEGEVCSSHGGCGTKAYELSSFNFIGDQYMDTLTAMNRKRYSNSLAGFYSSCLAENFVKQHGSFGFNVKKGGSSYFDPNNAFSACQDLNDHLDLDFTQETLRFYPEGKCVGIITSTSGIMDENNNEVQKYVPVILKSPIEEFPTDISIVPIFDCLSSDCSMELYENDDRTIRGFSTKLISPSFEIYIDYVHGYSTGQTQYIINGQLVTFDLVWTRNHIKLSIKNAKYGESQVLDQEGAFIRIALRFEMQSLSVIKYMSVVPKPDPNSVVYLAPNYDVKYTEINEDMNGYYFQIPSEDTGNERYLHTLVEAEYDCDQEASCLGLIRWKTRLGPLVNTVRPVETLYSLYTLTPGLNGFKTREMPPLASEDYTFLKKMSVVYAGRETSTSKCSVVAAGLSKYPTVDFTEDYNIPIRDIDIRLAQDEETKAVIVGDGYWSKCWERVTTITTKVGCYQYAEQQQKYGFAFSEDTLICLVYSGITDNTKIKLDRYNSEARLSLFDPCDEDASWFT